MRTRTPIVQGAIAALVLNTLLIGVPVAASQGSGLTRLISAAGTTRPVALASGSDAVSDPELRGGPGEAEVGRAQSGPAPLAAATAPTKKPKSNPQLKLDFLGLTHRDQRLANGGNQFSLEPPDQGLCVGNGFVLETINDVLRVYDNGGTPLSGVVDQNTFYGYPAAINRSTGEFGPFMADPSCLFDVATQRWFHAILTLDVVPATGEFTGKNHIDLAVSKTANPLGDWTIYRIPAQNDGTDGTPNHACSLGPCLGDFPHIGADAYGFYITTNEYSFFGPEFKSANIYAFSKTALAGGASSVTMVHFDTVGLDSGNPGFTVWPATSPGATFDTSVGGTEYFMSTNAAEEANGTGTSDDLLVWTLTNTSSLAGTPALSLSHTTLVVGSYSVPPKANQRPGDFPLGQCINDTEMETPFGKGCWRFFFEEEPAHDEVLSSLDALDSRIMQVVYANGKLWAALGTGLDVGGATKAGIEWFIVKPTSSPSGVQAKLALSGYLGLAGNNLTFPTVGVTDGGRGVIAFTVVGDDYYPSTAFAAIDGRVGVGAITLVEQGAGPADGFTSYKAFVGDPPRTRWGDYGAAVASGKTIWIASEYVHGTCNLATYVSDGFTCGRTRTALGNWSTRVAMVVP